MSSPLNGNYYVGLTGVIQPNKTSKQKGNITFHNMSLRYGVTGHFVLKNISCEIRSKEKVFLK